MLHDRFVLDHTTLQGDHEGGVLLQFDVGAGGSEAGA
jgi:hypothetical protein